jgi:hypothetical protein
MEFFAQITNHPVMADELFTLITIERLPALCASIDSVMSIESESHGEIYCLWGQFQVSRERIRNGVRIALLNCPHALAWTVAVHSELDAIVIHCTIDDRQAEPEFVESIELFVSDWAEGLRRHLAA